MYEQGSGSIERDARRMAPLVAKLLAAKNHTHAGSTFDQTKHAKEFFTAKQWTPAGDTPPIDSETGSNFVFDAWALQTAGTGSVSKLHLITFPGLVVTSGTQVTIRILAALTGGGSANQVRVRAQWQHTDTNLTTSSVGFGAQTLNCTGGGKNVMFFYDATATPSSFDAADDDAFLIQFVRDYDHADDTAADVAFIGALLSFEVAS